METDNSPVVFFTLEKQIQKQLGKFRDCVIVCGYWLQFQIKAFVLAECIVLKFLQANKRSDLEVLAIWMLYLSCIFIC